MKNFNSKYKLLLITLMVILILLLLKECNSRLRLIKRNDIEIKPEASYAVPLDATFIMWFNLEQILTELNFESLKNSKSYQDKLREYYKQNPVFTKIFADPYVTGVDTEKKALFYVEVGRKLSEVYSGSIICLKDVSIFQKVVKSTISSKINKEKYFEYVKIDGRSYVAWNNEFAVFITADPKLKTVNKLNQIFNTQAEKYYDKNGEFLEFATASISDASFWLDCTSYARNQILAKGKSAELPGLILKENYFFGNIDFNTGVVDIDVQFKLNKYLDQSLAKLFDAKSDRELGQFLPKGNPSFLTNLSLNLDGLFSVILSDNSLKLEARNELLKYGLMVDDFGKALTGDVLLAGFHNDTTSKNSVIFGLKIKDRQHFNKLLRVMQDVGQIYPESDSLFRMSMGVSPVFPLLATYQDKLQRLYLKDQYAFVSLDSIIISNLMAGISSSNDIDLLVLDTNMNDNYLTFYADRSLNQIKDVSEKFSIKNIKVNFKNSEFKLRLDLEDSEKSALKQLFSIN